MAYRLYYTLADKFQKPQLSVEQAIKIPDSHLPKLLPSIAANRSFLGNDSFRFLNLEQAFGTGINWNFSEHGKLWTYNLNYFEFLLQPDMTGPQGIRLIQDFICQSSALRDGAEPFPISLRVINWVKFVSYYRIRNRSIDQSLYLQLRRLSQRPEYHLLGNHLLENGFSLLFGAFYFRHQKWYRQAASILERELQEQVLPDGGHFELSPMYHQLMLFRVLDAINLIRHTPEFGHDHLLELLEKKASLMLGWLQNISFADGSVPRLNDTAPGIAPDTTELLAYARRLALEPAPNNLRESGYRKHTTTHYELLMDVGAIGPDYIPGHAHSDTFHFVLYHRDQPLLVDTGISTYEKNKRRQWERSTAAHNTVMVRNSEQSEIWGGFRVARRAKVIRLETSDSSLSATHDGYRSLGIMHTRTFELATTTILIKDEVSDTAPCRAFLHFHPDIAVDSDNSSVFGDFGKIQFENAHRIYIATYDYCTGFNQTRKASKITIEFDTYLITKIQLR